MNSISRYLKIAKDAVIKPSGSIDKKIIERISHIKKSDQALLDEKFMDYLKKSNSRAYLMLEKIRNNPGAFTVLIVAAISVAILIAVLIRKNLDGNNSGEENNQLSSSKDETQ